MNRRNFIRNSSSLALPLCLNGWGIQALGSEHFFSRMLRTLDTDNDRVLVLVQLTGGNDGLNTIIPLEHYPSYYAARKNIAIPEKELLAADKEKKCGFHPVLSGLQELYKEEKLAIIHSVGYPKPNLSHFSSTDIWMSGADDPSYRANGWAGRFCNETYPGFPEGYPSSDMPDPPAIQVGQFASLLFRGYSSYTSLNITLNDNVISLENGFRNKVGGRAGAELQVIRQMAAQTGLYTQVVKKALAKVKKQAEYPGTALASQLKLVAALISGGLKTRIYMVSIDGFDTHAAQAEQGDPSKGRHADLLKTTSDAIRAFQKDLEFLNIQERVTGMTFSEFGRRIVSNSSMGTDHGAAAPLFVFGEKVKSGFYGSNPVIPEGVSNNDNIPMQADFRSVYAGILRDWFRVPSSALPAILPGSIPAIRFMK